MVLDYSNAEVAFMPGMSVLRKNGEKDPRSDSQLMIDLCNGDQDAFSEIVDRFKRPLYSHLIRMLGNEEDAEEQLQMTFCRVFRYRNNYDPDRPLVTWIFTIASNLAKKEWRRRSRWTMVPLDKVVLKGSGTMTPHFREGRRELAASIEEAVNSLPEHYREPFLLREKQGLTYEEISDILGIRIGTVKSRINRARASLREALEDVWELWK
ncbi:MAG TPA: sigma-70 family RNA polymerase sigma factor [Candidatus Sabulitectum sp.]|nr:sigma-70 family RNA polymerase sigma factor [Candidatus Sabulitectum sp.]HPJ29505.1 sigma-70 family RNA polymerase sigma factor [Candidatus Sabulitectum sp.]HPR23323.1 sigma-70 family RNA polymerase sigma factor [Candidatus Sabulitectum sp.]